VVSTEVSHVWLSLTLSVKVYFANTNLDSFDDQPEVKFLLYLIKMLINLCKSTCFNGQIKVDVFTWKV